MRRSYIEPWFAEMRFGAPSIQEMKFNLEDLHFVAMGVIFFFRQNLHSSSLF